MNENENDSVDPAEDEPVTDPVPAEEPPEQTAAQAETAAELESLKARASAMGISFHPSIGEGKLRAKINKHIEDLEKQEAAAVPGPVTTTMTDVAARTTARQRAEAMVRVMVTCMDPSKRAYESEMFTVSNAVIGTHRRVIPFGKEWHIPRIIYNVLKDKKYMSFTTRRVNGVEIKERVMLPAYAIQELTPLTETELKELEQRQAMATGRQAA